MDYIQINGDNQFNDIWILNSELQTEPSQNSEFITLKK